MDVDASTWYVILEHIGQDRMNSLACEAIRPVGL